VGATTPAGGTPFSDWAAGSAKASGGDSGGGSGVGAREDGEGRGTGAGARDIPTSMSLTAYLNTYTSEDNDSFNTLLDATRAKL